MVIARLIDGDGKDRGVHNFIVPIRDYATHEPLAGVSVGDIGPKLGYNVMDNGFLKLDGVRVPRRNLGMRFIHVDEEGNFKKKDAGYDAAKKISYITMMQVRAQIVAMASTSLSQAVTIAVRYGLVRTQGYDGSGRKEVQILNYTQQQHRLFGHLACAYCFHFAGRRIMRKLKSLESAVLSGEGGSASKTSMSDLHASLSSLKAYCSDAAAAGIEDCRRSCGGHGYLVASGFPDLLNTYLQNPTVEGDNYVLPQQTAKVLLRLLEDIEGGEPMDQWRDADAAYLVDAVLADEGGGGAGRGVGFDNDPEFLLGLLRRRSCSLLTHVGERMRAGVEGGKGLQEVWNDSLVRIRR